MTSELDDLIRVTKKQINPAAEVLSRAFLDQPLHAYFFPDDSKRLKQLYYFFRFQLKLDMRYGELYATPNLKGVAG